MIRAKSKSLNIGTGISGLLAGKSLSQGGLYITILEKSRGVLDRLATHCFKHGILDQGAHKYNRTCYVDNYNERSILPALFNKAEDLEIPNIEDQHVWRFLVSENVCFGAVTFDNH
jgi:succinate dehydrogenase/fumarate reductase flavoprotein subunit